MTLLFWLSVQYVECRIDQKLTVDEKHQAIHAQFEWLTMDDNIGGEITLLLFTQLDLQINTAGESYA